MNQLVVLVILLIVIAGGYYYWQNAGWVLFKGVDVLLVNDKESSFVYDAGKKDKIVMRNVRYLAADGSGNWSKQMDGVLQDYIAANPKTGVINNAQLQTLLGRTSADKSRPVDYRGNVLFSFEYKYV